MKLSPTFLQRLEALPSLFRFRYSAYLRKDGKRKNKYRFGHGTEFSQHRKYNPGDDIRYIDWNLYARSQSFYIKSFSTEESQPVYILVDISKSMDFGSPVKFDFAISLSAGLSLLSLRSLDRVSVYLWDTSIRRNLINLRGTLAFPKVINFLESAVSSRNATDLEATCREFLNTKVIPGPIWIISDFYDELAFEHALSLLCNHRFIPLPIRVLNRHETSFNHSGHYTLIDSETGDSQRFLSTKSNKRKFAAQFERLTSQLREISHTHNVILREVMTDHPADDFLIGLLKDYQL